VDSKGDEAIKKNENTPNKLEKQKSETTKNSANTN
jgi:hypothetical protein